MMKHGDGLTLCLMAQKLAGYRTGAFTTFWITSATLDYAFAGAATVWNIEFAEMPTAFM